MCRVSNDRPTVLVVEDMAWIRASMKHSLGCYGYHVAAAESAHEAIPLAERVRPDLILTEEELPTFRELMSLLGRHPALSHVPVVILNPDLEDGAHYGGALILADYNQLERLLAIPASIAYAAGNEAE